jgi:hypothetical protein
VARQRRASWIVLGVLLVVGGALLFAVLAMGFDRRTSVIAVARPVPAGQVIKATDLKVVHIAADGGLRAMPVSKASAVVGKTAAVDLAPNTLLASEDVGVGSGLSNGKAVLGLALKAGQLPADLGAGDKVNVIDTGDDQTRSAVIATARVTKVEKGRADVGGGSLLVSLVVDENVAPTITSAAAHTRVALAAVSSR